ncbi:CPBP family intramembrane glutamic endopeptidase [Paenibacillus terrigena]|uniref:CPBP family intramembrane glutamic endopeptidase n=1 Tax=Paenibacillus terrigena TaxID=369333 RepID=UPI0028D3D8E4|nr:CPBP family intramembrane glutamic endopeptidase [Paenibacillus terrigena]
MNHLGNRLQLQFNRKILLTLGTIGLIIFILLQVLPAFFSPQASEAPNQPAISKEAATDKALAFVKQNWPQANPNAVEASISYATNSNLYGYLVSNKLLDKYHKTFVQKYPYEYYRVEIPERNVPSKAYYIYLNMQSGEVISWKMFTPEDTPSLRTKDELIDAAKQHLAKAGYDINLLTVQQTTSEKNFPNHTNIVLEDTSRKIGESTLLITVQFIQDEISSVTPAFSVPESHLLYVQQQQRNANWMTGLGYYLLTVALAVLAIVYSILKRRYTSFKRGIFLALLYTGLSIFSFFNIMPAMKAMSGDMPVDDTLLIATALLQCVVTVIMGVATYFSFVGGDALWRERGLNPWPRFREPGYGDYVFRSMGIGYITAFFLLGLQVIIYIALSITIGTWSTTDATQSTYNMIYPLLFPLMAWVAGIGEEATYRLFGIIMLKKIVRNTFIACLISTLIWAFGHTLYPIYPTYSRPIELIFLGLGFSWIFFRYGFITAVFAHVIFDSIGMGLSVILMKNGTTYTLIGLGYMILPAIVAWVIRWFCRMRYPNDPNEPVEPIQPKEKEPLTTTPPEALV